MDVWKCLAMIFVGLVICSEALVIWMLLTDDDQPGYEDVEDDGEDTELEEEFLYSNGRIVNAEERKDTPKS